MDALTIVISTVPVEITVSIDFIIKKLEKYCKYKLNSYVRESIVVVSSSVVNSMLLGEPFLISPSLFTLTSKFLIRKLEKYHNIKLGQSRRSFLTFIGSAALFTGYLTLTSFLVNRIFTEESTLMPNTLNSTDNTIPRIKRIVANHYNDRGYCKGHFIELTDGTVSYFPQKDYD